MHLLSRILLSKLVGFVVAVVTIATIFLAAALLNIMGKDHGRWQSFTMFLPALLLFFWGTYLRRNGRGGVGAYIVSGLFFAFGGIVLFKG